MPKPFFRVAAAGALCLALFLPCASNAVAQTVTPVPHLDLQKYIGAWYKLASFPLKPYKRCTSDSVVLYALSYKPNRFSVVTSCQTASTTPESRNANGKLDKSNDGRVKVTYMWPFSTKEWVLALGPDYSWALIGSPNHKSLWILSRTPTLKPDTLAEINAKATSQGFDITKLVPIAHHPGTRELPPAPAAPSPPAAP